MCIIIGKMEPPILDLDEGLHIEVFVLNMNIERNHGFKS